MNYPKIFLLMFISLLPLFAYPYGGRDPFVSLEKSMIEKEERKEVKVKPAKKELSKLLVNIHLQGVIWSKNKQLAIINEQILKEGEEFKGFIIKKIMPQKVVLKYGEEEIAISITPPEEEEGLNLTPNTPNLPRIDRR